MAEEETDYADTYAGLADGGGFNVNPENLSGAIGFLTTIKSFVDKISETGMANINTTIGVGADNYTVGRAHGGNPLGGFTSAEDGWTRLQSTVATMMTSLSTLSSRLEHMATVTQTIIDTYQDTESRNTASAADITKILETYPTTS